MTSVPPLVSSPRASPGWGAVWTPLSSPAAPTSPITIHDHADHAYVRGYDDATITIHDHADHAYVRGNMKRFQTA